MPLERARRRAFKALQNLRAAQNGAASGAIKVELICDALEAVRDLLMVNGDELEARPSDKRRLAALRFLADDLPTLILALEITAVRAENLLQAHDDPAGHEQSMHPPMAGTIDSAEVSLELAGQTRKPE